ncbi:LysR family transcriptional regulator [Albimonas pacifica]|uniref:Transcriptional regulator /transcriptional regulator, LysR family n=1 Tax=Albimonas pacifica TaxID=1114924 RepID=A0A1I3NDU1_9RHOB|nr:LysR family transcriptional regulator [Albimonas pacifica]SFJ07474.1 transcriptional regulator /transcriptional regulator, LysR family [Albimonas pacifica]
MDIRQLRYLIALARERHFSRAAEACAVTQPTLSARIRQLEEELGVPLVARGQRFHGLTPEGERVLRWARRIVEDWDGLRDDLSVGDGGPEGRLTLGVIPSALPAVAPLVTALRARWPKVRFQVLSRSSARIAQALEAFEIDAGLTYLDEATEPFLVRPLYAERYRLFTAQGHPLAGRASLGWAEAAALPLCALTPDMRNRRIVDAAFAEAGAAAEPEVESNSMLSLLALVRSGGFCAVLPERLQDLAGGAAGLAAVPLSAPEVSRPVGLAALARDPLPLLVEGLMQAAEAAMIDPMIDPMIDGADQTIETGDLKS